MGVATSPGTYEIAKEHWQLPWNLGDISARGYQWSIRIAGEHEKYHGNIRDTKERRRYRGNTGSSYCQSRRDSPGTNHLRLIVLTETDGSLSKFFSEAQALLLQ